MNKFTLGLVAGASSLALAVPLLAQVAGAASSDGSVDAPTVKIARTPPSQACVSALVAVEDAHIANLDAHIATQKTIMKTHRDALAAASLLTDETERLEAVKKANEDFHTAMKNSMESDTSMKTVTDAAKAACGDSFPGHGGMGGMMMGGQKKGMFGKMGRGHHRGPMHAEDPTESGSTSSAQ